MRLFVEVDLAQAEWVVTGFLANDRRMIEVFEKGEDPHIATGTMIAGCPVEFTFAEKELVGSQTDPEVIAELRAPLLAQYPEWQKWFLPRSMSIRQAGKKSNHGLNYYMRYKRFALENEITEPEADKIVQLYYAIYPGLSGMYEWVKEQLRRDRTLTNCFGQKRRFERAWGDDLLQAAYAWTPQSTVGEIGKRGFTAIYEDQRLAELDCILAANTHDSVTTDVGFQSLPQLAEVTSRCRRHLTIPCEYHSRVFTLRTDIKIGLTWGNMVGVHETDNLIEDLERALEDARKAVSVDQKNNEPN